MYYKQIFAQLITKRPWFLFIYAKLLFLFRSLRLAKCFSFWHWWLNIVTVCYEVLTEINKLHRVHWRLWSCSVARSREVPHMRVLPRHWRSSSGELRARASLKVVARVGRWLSCRRQRLLSSVSSLFVFKRGRIDILLGIRARALPRSNDAVRWTHEAKRDFSCRFFVVSR